MQFIYIIEIYYRMFGNENDTSRMYTSFKGTFKRITLQLMEENRLRCILIMLHHFKNIKRDMNNLNILERDLLYNFLARRICVIHLRTSAHKSTLLR